MSGHTPGPWRIEDGTTLIWGNCNPDDRTSYGMGYPVADGHFPRRYCTERPTIDEIDGNVRLIAAAPDLLAALKGLISMLDPSGDFDDPNSPIADAILAIAKAEGAQS